MQEANPQPWPSGRRVGLMAGLAVLAILAFSLLADVRLSYEEPLFDGLTPNLPRLTWTLVLLAVEAFCVILLVVLLLVRPVPKGGESGDDATEENADMWTVEDANPTGPVDDTRVQIGCPGCGTIFVKPLVDVDEPHEQDFACPNCGRPGRLRLGLHKSAPLRTVACVQCSAEFTAYRDGAECPHCHALNA